MFAFRSRSMRIQQYGGCRCRRWIIVRIRMNDVCENEFVLHAYLHVLDCLKQFRRQYLFLYDVGSVLHQLMVYCLLSDEDGEWKINRSSNESFFAAKAHVTDSRMRYIIYRRRNWSVCYAHQNENTSIWSCSYRLSLNSELWVHDFSLSLSRLRAYISYLEKLFPFLFGVSETLEPAQRRR